MSVAQTNMYHIISNTLHTLLIRTHPPFPGKEVNLRTLINPYS